jgi:hypothetical protein
MKQQYKNTYIGIFAFALTLFAACVEEGDGLYLYNTLERPSINTYNGVTTNSVTLDKGGYDAVMVADNYSMEGGKEFPLSGKITIGHLRPGKQYYVAYIVNDRFGGKISGQVASFTTKDYDAKVVTKETTQAVFDMGKAEYDCLKLATDGHMTYTAVNLQNGNEVWYLQPNTTYYWVTEATDLFGYVYRSPEKSFTTRDYDMYVESVSDSDAIFNANSVYFTRLLISDRQDMSKILTEGSNRKRTLISGLKPSTTYYVQTEATDMYGTTYRSPVYPITTTAYHINILPPTTTSATALLRAKIGGDTTGRNPSVRFYVYANGVFMQTVYANYDAVTGEYQADLALLSNKKSYTVTASVYENGSEYTKSASLAFSLDSHHAANAVDMGLSVKWASWNVGARSPEEYGGLYYYGDTDCGVSTTSWVNQYNISGTYRDIAHMAWGGSWRMPTFDELKELHDNSTMAPDVYNGVAGYRITSTRNGNSIFVPAAGTRSNYSYTADNRGIRAEIYSGTASDYYLDHKDQYGQYHYGLYRVWYYYLTDNYMLYDLYANDYQIGRSIRPVQP